ncbi:MAG: pyrroline-5-carboxylate reductase [Gammaproteobacteria bacterium]|nr:pyrroline-5-carboxylate reductase [Gammaproteobacteria bacterium]
MNTALGTTRIAFVGGGNMARALIAGLLRQGATAPLIGIGEPDAAQRAALTRDFGVLATADNAAATAGARCVVLAIKPQEMAGVARDLAPQLGTGTLLLSVAAGITTSDLARWFAGRAVVRAMPNRPALVGAGVTGMYAPAGLDASDRALADALMSAAGRTVWVARESDLDTVTALSGSGPAYFFLLAEQMAAAGVALGLDRAAAQLLAAETLYGAGQLAHADPALDRQRIAVTSKGGTTEAALASFAASGFDALVHAAIQAATRRSAELARQFGSGD